MAEQDITSVKNAETPFGAVKAVLQKGTAVKRIRKNAEPVRTERPSRPKLLISVLNPDDDEKMAQILNEYSVSLNYAFAGTGTARSNVLDYLGIDILEKSVMFSLIPECDEDLILGQIQKKMALYLVGRGISFTLPLSGISEIVAKGIASSEKTIDGSKIMKDENRKYDLIVVEVEAGYVEEVMEVARTAGAAGGTIVRARSVGNSKAEQFIGISLQKESEILLILSNRESKQAIMQAISEKAGLKTDAGGIIFSLPVDKTVGIGASGSATDALDANDKK